MKKKKDVPFKQDIQRVAAPLSASKTSDAIDHTCYATVGELMRPTGNLKAPSTERRILASAVYQATNAQTMPSQPPIISRTVLPPPARLSSVTGRRGTAVRAQSGKPGLS